VPPVWILGDSTGLGECSGTHHERSP